MDRSTTASILMGGPGKRLFPLTITRPKPSVMNRVDRTIGDDALENCICSGNIKDIICITQYLPKPLERHLSNQKTLLNALRNIETTRHLQDIANEIEKQEITQAVVRSHIHISNPAEGAVFKGTADALYQVRKQREDEGRPIKSKTNLILAGDHAYKCDASQLEDYHLRMKANLTIMAIPKRVEDAANKLGVIVVDPTGKVIGFEEKPPRPSEIPGRPGWCWASMGIYAFDETLEEVLEKDQRKERIEHEEDRSKIIAYPDKYTSNDFGFDIIPMMLREGYAIFVYDFATNIVPGASERERGYWRDIGTLDDYYNSNIELTDDNPVFNIHNKEWSANLPQPHRPPTDTWGTYSTGLIGNGVRARNAHIYHAIVSAGVIMEEDVDINKSIVFPDCHIGRKVRIKNSILEKDLYVPDGEQIGYDLEYDERRGFTVTRSGIVVVPKGYVFKRGSNMTVKDGVRYIQHEGEEWSVRTKGLDDHN